MDPHYASKVFEMNGQLDVRPVLGAIQAPTLVLHRRDDNAFDIRHSEYLAEHIPNATFRVLEGADTLPFLGDSDAVLGEIEEFLTGARVEREPDRVLRSEEHTSELQSRQYLVCRLLLEKKKTINHFK